MPSHVPQREYWTGEQTELGDAWTLTKGDKTARCMLLSHLFGHELRLGGGWRVARIAGMPLGRGTARHALG